MPSPSPALILDPRTGVTTGASVPYGSARFTAASSQYLATADAAAWRITGPFYVAFWVKFATVANVPIMCKGNPSAWATTDWYVDYSSVTGGVRLVVSNGTAPSFSNFAITPNTTSVYFVECTYDGTNLTSCVNRGTPASVAMSGTPNVTSGALTVGVGQGFGFWDGSLGSLFISHTIPSSTDRDWLYNAGAGRTSGDVSASKPGLIPASGSGDWFDMNEPNMTRRGQFNGSALAMPRLNFSGVANANTNAPSFGAAIVTQPATSLAKITGIADQSGNGHDATCAGGSEVLLDPNGFGPGLPAFRFDGFASRMTVPATLAKERGFTYQSLIRLNASNADAMRLARVLGSPADGSGQAQFALGVGRAGNTTWGGLSPCGGFAGAGSAQFGPSSGATIADLTSPVVLTFRYRPSDGAGTPSAYNCFLNNVQVPITTNAAAIGAAPVTVSDFGWDGIGQLLDGLVGPKNLWDFPADDADIFAGAAAICTAYGITHSGTDPTDSPSTINQVVCLGDSMTLGLYTTNSGVVQQDGSLYPNSYPNQLQTLLGSSWSTLNLGIGGAGIESVISQELTPACQAFRPYAARNVAFVSEFVNSLIAGDTPAQIYAQIVTCVAKLKANGSEVGVISCPSYATGSPLVPVAGWAAKQAACDALVAANTAGADYLLYPSQISQLADATNTTYVSDGLHYTAAGYLIEAQAIFGLLNATTVTLSLVSAVASTSFAVNAAPSQPVQLGAVSASATASFSVSAIMPVTGTLSMFSGPAASAFGVLVTIPPPPLLISGWDGVPLS